MGKTKPNEITVKIHVDTTDLDEAVQKAERLRMLLKEASSLAGELASKGINVSVSVGDGPKFMPETADGPCISKKVVVASSAGNQK